MTEYDVKAVMYKKGPKGERLEVKYIRGHVIASTPMLGGDLAVAYVIAESS